MLAELTRSRSLILGAGVTGSSLARSLAKRGGDICLVDDHVGSIEGFPILTPEKVALDEWDFIITSPGWKPDHPLIVAAQSSGKKILNEVDIAWWLKQEIAPTQKWLALTGTNGKTSTVELTAAALRQAGLHAIACGNVGTTVIEALESGEGYEFLVVELSSFQLHWMEDAAFVAVAILNIADDHIDWHGSFENYTRDKVKILDRASTAILNGNDGTIVEATQHWMGRKVFFTLDTPSAGELGVVEDLLVDRAFVADPMEAQEICELADITPCAPHTIANALAAAGLARAAGAPHGAIKAAIAGFTPGRHRIELIDEREGIRWIDDSKATNPHAALASLFAAPSNIWIAGGLLKDADIAPLVERARHQIKAVILIGRDAPIIERVFTQIAPEIPRHLISQPHSYIKGGADNSLMEAIVQKARSLATSGDTVLMAPACASMDQFISYADRGDRFAQAVRKAQ